MGHSPILLRCESCELGAVFAVGRGGFCPLLHRDLITGEALYAEGDRGDHLWLVKSGALELLSSGGDTIGIRTPGMFVGAEALRVGRFLSAARALAPTRLCGIPRAEWQARNLGRGGADFMWLAPALRARLEDERGEACANS